MKGCGGRAPRRHIGLTTLAVVAMIWAAMPHARASEVLVVSQTAAELAIIETTTDEIAHRIKLDATPAAVAVSRDGTQAYVTHPELHQLSVIDLKSRSVIARRSVGLQPFAVAVDGKGNVWVGDWRADVVLRMNIETGVIMQTLSVGASPSAILFSADDSLLYAVNRESNDITAVNTSTGETVARTDVGRAPFAIAASSDGNWLYVVNVQSSTVAVVDAQNFQTTRHVKVGQMPYGVAIDDLSGRVIVTNQQSASATIFNGNDGQVITTVRIGQYPEGVVVVPGTGKAYVANWFSDQISVIDIRSGKELKRLTCAAGPRMLAVRPGPSS